MTYITFQCYPQPQNIYSDSQHAVRAVQSLKTVWITSSGTSGHDLLQLIQQELQTWENPICFGYIGSHSNLLGP